MKNEQQARVMTHLVKNRAEILLIEKSCRIVADTLSLVEKYVKPGVETIELDRIAEDYIRSQNARPAFKGYRVDRLVFPNTLCISINEEVVHGIPSQRKLMEGDIVSIDCGCEKDGYYGDSALTIPVGEIDEEKQHLLKITEESLFLGIEQAKNKNKVYDISRAVQNYVEDNGYSVTRELVGHGIGKNLHEDPPVPNFVPALLNRSQYPNIKLLTGMTIAIEPMVHAGKKEIKTGEDGWLVYTADHKPAAHFEHTVMIDNDKALILTLRN